jgi:hypothetical protein
MKLKIGDRIWRQISDNTIVVLEVKDITIIAGDSMPFVGVNLSRWIYEDDKMISHTDNLATVFDEIVSWLKEPGWNK